MLQVDTLIILTSSTSFSTAEEHLDGAHIRTNVVMPLHFFVFVRPPSNQSRARHKDDAHNQNTIVRSDRMSIVPKIQPQQQ